MPAPKSSRRIGKIVYSEEELATARTHVERWWKPCHYISEDEDHPSNEEMKERYVRQDVRSSRRRAKYAHMRREWEEYPIIEHLFKKRGQIGNSKEWYDQLPRCQQRKIRVEARRVYRRDFDAQFPLSPSVHASSESSEAPSSEDSYEKHDRRKEKQARIGIQTWLRYRRDHPHAFSYRPRPTPTQPFNFMGLPVEMRCEILRLLLERNKELTDVSANATFPNATFPNATFEPYEMVPVDTRLFAVSRQMQEDAKIVFFSSNTIRMPITLCRLPLFIRKPPPSIRQLRKVHVSIIHNFEVLDQPRLAENLERVADLLKECKKLVQLKILQSCLDSLRDTYSKHLFRESLEYFTRVQEVGEVILTEDEPPKDVGFSWIVPPEDMITRLKTVMQSPKTE